MPEVKREEREEMRKCYEVQKELEINSGQPPAREAREGSLRRKSLGVGVTFS